MQHKIQTITAYFVLMLFVAYYAGITLFVHSHTINGVTIVHSHPYKSKSGSDAPNHSHAERELQVIQTLSNFVTTCIDSGTATSTAFQHSEKLADYTYTQYLGSTAPNWYQLRGPPVLHNS